MKKHVCSECKRREKYDDNPKSFVGRVWRWHINFCPGWKSYMKNLDKESRVKLKERYLL